MFNHPSLLYWCWKDAKRESKRYNGGGGGGGFVLIFIAILFIVCLWRAAVEVGGFGVIMALAMTIGMLQGIYRD